MTNDLFDSLTIGNSHQRLFAFCRAFGVTRINLEYSGGGDSGGTDSVEVLPKNVDKKVSRFIREELEDDLSQPIYNRHGSFADGGGYSVSGTVVYDVDGKKAWIEGTDHHYEYSETEDGEEENCNDEDFEEMIYEENENDHGNDRDYKFAVHYAILSGTPFSPVYHNQMIAAAIADDEDAKEYVAWAEKK